MTKARLEAFSDGVFGVAITLLVLDVRIEGGGTGWEMLSREWHHILVYLLSFVIVGVYWVAHHNMMHFITATDKIMENHKGTPAYDQYQRERKFIRELPILPPGSDFSRQ